MAHFIRKKSLFCKKSDFFKVLYKKSEAGFIFIFFFVIIILFLGLFANLDHSGFDANEPECKGNRDCGSEAYCGSDFSCHTFPTVQKTVVQNNFVIPSIIIGIAIIIVAIIFRWKKVSDKEDSEQVKEETITATNKQIPEEVDEINEPYYKSKSNIKTP